jgi:UDP:flavonoid glycosyltransferase YjiC (YdhE family)
MRVLLAPHGTRGDVQPMLALATGLRARGYDVSFVAPANSVPWITSLGFQCFSDGIDVEQMMQGVGTRLQSLRWQMKYLTDILIPKLFETVSAAADAANPSIIVGSGVQMAASSVADLRGIPSASVMFAPCAVPSSDSPPPVVRSQNLPRWLNRALWKWGAPLADKALARPMNAARARLGLPPHPKPSRLLGGRRTIVAADRELSPFPADAPSAAVSTDAWTLNESGSAIDSALDDFLRCGPPPIYLGLGSMVAKPGLSVAAQVAGAARAVGCRLVVAGGWARIDRGMEVSDSVMIVREAPHPAIFPRMKAVIHHGGAGTTTAAARAGVPQLILPHILDQYYWAHRVQLLGIGPRALPIETITTERLTSRCRELLESTDYPENARTLAARMGTRDGVADAVSILEQLVKES